VADVIDYDDIMDTYDLLDAAYEPNAKWLMRKNTWSQIRGIVDLNGRPIVQDSTTGITGAPVKTLLGFPVVIDEARARCCPRRASPSRSPSVTSARRTCCAGCPTWSWSSTRTPGPTNGEVEFSRLGAGRRHDPEPFRLRHRP
jgi:hypothetical protein